MTEKDYSGVTTSKIGKNVKINQGSDKKTEFLQNKSKKESSNPEKIEQPSTTINLEYYKKAGEISKKVKIYAKELIKQDMLLVEIAEKIEAKIFELGGEPAFPVNLSIDDVAAHFTPRINDTLKASGLLKVDFGVHVNGCIADTAFSLDLTDEKKYTQLIKASEKALAAALEYVKTKKSQAKINEIGEIIHKTIVSENFAPIRNLSGHSLEEFEIHAGISIPNYNNGNTKNLNEGAYAIEPFATTGAGVVYEGSGSNIYHLVKQGQVRDAFSREILNFLLEKKKSLPFSERELERKFNKKVIFALNNLKNAGIIQEFAQLIEKDHGIVSQAEHSLIISNNIVTIISD